MSRRRSAGWPSWEQRGPARRAPAEWDDLALAGSATSSPCPIRRNRDRTSTSSPGCWPRAARRRGVVRRPRRNGAIVAGANQQALNPVLRGAKAAVFGAVDYIALESRARGESVEVIFPASGTVIAPRPAMILASSRNPEAAKRFLDYMLSDDGQRRVARLFLMPARPEIPAERPTIAEIRSSPSTIGRPRRRRADICPLPPVVGV